MSLCLCVAQVGTAGLGRDRFVLPVMVLHGWDGRGCSLQVGRQEAKRGKRREKKDDCEKSKREGKGRDKSSA